ncbi:MAG: hypothetical protein RL607_673 [Bacteroidota bacterium]|jgi:hypothetical protein
MAFGDNADFSTSGVSLADLTIRSGAFQGKTVSQILTLANATLANEVTAYSLLDITAVLAAINTNYVGGSDNNFLKCPTEPVVADEEPIVKSNSFVVFPNPVVENANIEFALNSDSNVEIQLYTINGQLLTSVFNGKVKSGEQNSVSFTTIGMKSGVYFMKMITDTAVETKSVIVGQ